MSGFRAGPVHQNPNPPKTHHQSKSNKATKKAAKKKKSKGKQASELSHPGFCRDTRVLGFTARHKAAMEGPSVRSRPGSAYDDEYYEDDYHPRYGEGYVADGPDSDPEDYHPAPKATRKVMRIQDNPHPKRRKAVPIRQVVAQKPSVIPGPKIVPRIDPLPPASPLSSHHEPSGDEYDDVHSIDEDDIKRAFGNSPLPPSEDMTQFDPRWFVNAACKCGDMESCTPLADGCGRSVTSNAGNEGKCGSDSRGCWKTSVPMFLMYIPLGPTKGYCTICADCLWHRAFILGRMTAIYNMVVAIHDPSERGGFPSGIIHDLYCKRLHDYLLFLNGYESRTYGPGKQRNYGRR